MHGTLKTHLTHYLAEHIGENIALSLLMNQAPTIKLPCIEVLRLFGKPLGRTNKRNTNTKLIPDHYPQEMISYCQTILTIAISPNLTMLMNTKPVLVKLTIIIDQLVLLL